MFLFWWLGGGVAAGFSPPPPRPMLRDGGTRPGMEGQKSAGSGFQGDLGPLGAGEEWLGTWLGESSRASGRS